MKDANSEDELSYVPFPMAGGKAGLEMELELARESRARERELGIQKGASIVDRGQFFNTEVGKGYQHRTVVRQPTARDRTEKTVDMTAAGAMKRSRDDRDGDGESARSLSPKVPREPVCAQEGSEDNDGGSEGDSDGGRRRKRKGSSKRRKREKEAKKHKRHKKENSSRYRQKHGKRHKRHKKKERKEKRSKRDRSDSGRDSSSAASADDGDSGNEKRVPYRKRETSDDVGSSSAGGEEGLAAAFVPLTTTVWHALVVENLPALLQLRGLLTKAIARRRDAAS